mmetsp:Transcript_22422/g.39984  ORF Transcript_22422/g.39984 Transcript_22422/m.39984 type:complete len:114 (+) Transcript_22422:79-420(+)
MFAHRTLRSKARASSRRSERSPKIPPGQQVPYVADLSLVLMFWNGEPETAVVPGSRIFSVWSAFGIIQGSSAKVSAGATAWIKAATQRRWNWCPSSGAPLGEIPSVFSMPAPT